jgi:hypothetical protein
MDSFCKLIWSALVGLFRSRASLQAENLVLRHQLNVLRRKSPRRITSSAIDRLLFVGLYAQRLGCAADRQTRYRDPVASRRLSGLLAQEIAIPRRSASEDDSTQLVDGGLQISLRMPLKH